MTPARSAPSPLVRGRTAWPAAMNSPGPGFSLSDGWDQGGGADIYAEQITPYPFGIPVIIPGERITEELLAYLRSGLAAGMQLPDLADSSLGTIPVVSQPAEPTGAGV